MGIKTGKVVECVICNKEIYRAKWELKERNFCSRECADRGHAILLTKRDYKRVNCPECGKEFQQSWNGPKKFCSTPCSSRYNLAIINSKEPLKKGTRPEKEFAELLDFYNIEYIFQKAVPWKRGWKKWYDFYIPESNALIEVDGTYWHGQGLLTSQLNNQQWKTRINDRFKNYLAKERGYILKRIWSNEINSLSYIKLKQLLYE